MHRGDKPRTAIILGAGSNEYRIFKALENAREFDVMFFIDDEPWNHRTTIGKAQLRYPSELVALCENYCIDTVFYCDESKLLDLPHVPCNVVRLNV